VGSPHKPQSMMEDNIQTGPPATAGFLLGG
jgi:hypothetical protein